MKGDGPAEHLPIAIADMKRRDGDKIARAVFDELSNLGPRHVPPPFAAHNPTAIGRWREGLPVKDEEIPDLAQWLAHTANRTTVISENTRRLHVTTWAQRRLRGTDFEQHFVEFHRHEWGLVIGEDYEENERQLLAAARRGMQPTRNRETRG